MKARPLAALEEFRNNQGNSTGWYTIFFRLYVGLELGRAYFTKEAEEGLRDAITALRAIRSRFIESDKTTWKATAGEIDLLRMGLEATDEMQDKTTRREQLDAHLKAGEITKEQARVFGEPQGI